MSGRLRKGDRAKWVTGDGEYAGTVMYRRGTDVCVEFDLDGVTGIWPESQLERITEQETTDD